MNPGYYHLLESLRGKILLAIDPLCHALGAIEALLAQSDDRPKQPYRKNGAPQEIALVVTAPGPPKGGDPGTPPSGGPPPTPTYDAFLHGAPADAPAKKPYGHVTAMVRRAVAVLQEPFSVEDIRAWIVKHEPGALVASARTALYSATSHLETKRVITQRGSRDGRNLYVRLNLNATKEEIARP